MKTYEQKLAELRAASAQLAARRETEFAAINEAIATHRAAGTADPDHGQSYPMANQEAALIGPVVVTEDLVQRCAAAIARKDRFTAHPLSAEEQARAVLEYLANVRANRPLAVRLSE